MCTWRQKSTYGENIRDFSDNNLILTLPTVLEDQKYQDTGEYICTAENGIIGINGQLKQTGSGYVISNGNILTSCYCKNLLVKLFSPFIVLGFNIFPRSYRYNPRVKQFLYIPTCCHLDIIYLSL